VSARNKLIVEQQLMIRKLTRKLDEAKDREREIDLCLYCVGGPLNDNKLGHTKEQLRDFWDIARALKGEHPKSIKEPAHED
jgi:hypothetical protein